MLFKINAQTTHVHTRLKPCVNPIRLLHSVRHRLNLEFSISMVNRHTKEGQILQQVQHLPTGGEDLFEVSGGVEQRPQAQAQHG